MTEMVIQQLLIGRRRGRTRPGPRDGRAPAASRCAADWRTLRSPETYVGYGQSTGFASEVSPRSTSPHDYRTRAASASTIGRSTGTWTVARRAACSTSPADGSRSVPRPRREPRHGTGVAGRLDPLPRLPRRRSRRRRARDRRRRRRPGTVDEQRTYQLIRQPGQIEERMFEIEFFDRVSRRTASPSAERRHSLARFQPAPDSARPALPHA